jgi:hypothetical protein
MLRGTVVVAFTSEKEDRWFPTFRCLLVVHTLQFILQKIRSFFGDKKLVPKIGYAT